MRIIGGHDYYDSALAYGHDTQVVLVRERDKTIDEKTVKAIGLNSRWCYLPVERSGHHRTWGHVTVIIGDKLHAGVVHCDFGGDPRYAWNKDAFDKLLADTGQNIPSGRWAMYRPEYEQADYFEPVNIHSKLRDYMIEQRISIITNNSRFNPEEWTVNRANLKELDFAKRIDPYTLFQELEMWNSGVLGMGTAPTVEVSNEVKIHKHGFDKFSFRKPKAG